MSLVLILMTTEHPQQICGKPTNSKLDHGRMHATNHEVDEQRPETQASKGQWTPIICVCELDSAAEYGNLLHQKGTSNVLVMSGDTATESKDAD